MWDRLTRRSVLKGLGTTIGAAAVGPQVVGAEPIEGRYVVNTDTVPPRGLRGNPDVTVVHDLDSEIGFVVARAPGRAMEAMGPNAEYARDLRIERGLPEEEPGPTVNETASESDSAPALYPLQWDKRNQGLRGVHDDGATGEGARVGIIDDGVLGASQQFSASHPDLDTINEQLSTSFVPRPEDGGDNFGAGPLADDHGTHVAGTVAAAGEVGTVGTAPEAEIVDIRVFSGLFATFGDVAAAVVYGADVGCDALNLSLGSGPLLPVAPGTDPDAVDAPPGLFPVPADALAVLVKLNAAVGRYAVDNGALPIAAAGNDGVDLDRTFEVAFDGSAGGVDFDGSAVSLPNEADGFVSVAATGPIGYGWPLDAGDALTTEPRELRFEEPAFFTNYGPDAVDVSAAGGNADTDAIGLADPVSWFNDLVLSTTFQIPDDAAPNGDNGIPEDTQLGNDYTPSYGWKAGTSMAAPQVTGLAALLAAADPSAGPTEIRDRIESTARQIDVGLVADEDATDEANGETTAPAQGVSIGPVLASGTNVALDGEYDGDVASNPDSVDLTESKYDSGNFRGEGHIDVAAAVDGFGGSSAGGGSASGGGSP